MANHVKFCGCRTCKSGRKTARNNKVITRVLRRLRHNVKVALLKGREPDAVASVPYTD